MMLIYERYMYTLHLIRRNISNMYQILITNYIYNTQSGRRQKIINILSWIGGKWFICRPHLHVMCRKCRSLTRRKKQVMVLNLYFVKEKVVRVFQHCI